ncbi:hypothetical protein N825_26305 [Skermanella stibiiresistens SB22]|uniref:Uncharacterized protein n=1 Tax=Skermanella stibiiresistens SB22 TaxID=1385369 RepID=W9GV64_9PROT|nr:hypothetical protein [Skermanella stibiiresistens]EWY36551.1 hypothetical protein N825_26305 [Skermanella stibiiresistens SB22]
MNKLCLKLAAAGFFAATFLSSPNVNADSLSPDAGSPIAQSDGHAMPATENINAGAQVVAFDDVPCYIVRRPDGTLYVMPPGCTGTADAEM